MIKGAAPLRGTDKYGSGAFGAPREGREHNGLDIAFVPGTGIFSLRLGRVTKIGFPHSIEDTKKGHLRYVQVTDTNGYDARYFYLNPCVKVGEVAESWRVIGTTQNLQGIYPGIVDHIHFEVKKNGQFIDPNMYLKRASWLI
jgi:murein DD-endopeptidase MepM/ murein hydrolase activator NlpD